MNNLQNLNVLLTRPLEEGKKLLAKIREHSGHGYLCPIINIKPITSENSALIIQNLNQYDKVICTSTHAVNYGLEAIKNKWAQLPKTVHWYAVGKTTAETLKHYQIDATFPKDSFNSESLLKISDFDAIAKQKILIIKGLYGRPLLAETLRERGAQIDILNSYQREPVPYAKGIVKKIMSDHKINVIVLTSCEIVTYFVQAVESNEILDIPIIVPSQRISQHAKNYGFLKIHVSRSAENDAILQSLIEVNKISGWISN